MTKQKVLIPPIKSQGIKTKLISYIQKLTQNCNCSRLVEPFMGTGVVGFNLKFDEYLMCDSNPHLINFYKCLQNDHLNPSSIKAFLEVEGALLLKKGAEHYYYVRERFNSEHSPLDFLFLNRAGFNGMIRFNKKGEFNIPFCKKPNRFAKSYITKITNQVQWVYERIHTNSFTFLCQDFRKTLSMVTSGDFIYCDPPYIGRHVDYYNGWTDGDEHELYSLLNECESKFLLSTWHGNHYRENSYVGTLWSSFNIYTHDHFYHVGGNENNRTSMTEALVTNY